MVSQQKYCGNCANGIDIEITGDVLCNKKGVVERGYVCFKHKRDEDRPKGLKCLSCSSFIVDKKSENPDIGHCKLFTVRKFNGLEKNVCSRFAKLD